MNADSAEGLRLIRERKQQIRRQMREKLERLTPEALDQASRRIREQVLALPAYRDAHTVMAFMSMAGEPETRGIIRDAVSRGKQILLPCCLDGHRLEAALFTGFEDLVPGKLRIPEPQESVSPVPDPDLILVPCVSASRNGKRLGHGAGYYDRFLRNQTALKVCLCFEAFLADDLPTDEYDILMDLVISDHE